MPTAVTPCKSQLTGRRMLTASLISCISGDLVQYMQHSENKLWCGGGPRILAEHDIPTPSNGP